MAFQIIETTAGFEVLRNGEWCWEDNGQPVHSIWTTREQAERALENFMRGDALTYLETYNRVVGQRREDYRRATEGRITWCEYARRWGVA